jgi:hypothetical protein
MTTSRLSRARGLCLAAALLSCFRAGGAGGGGAGCGIDPDAGVGPALGSFTGTETLFVAGESPRTVTRTLAVLGAGSRVVRAVPGGALGPSCSVLGEADACFVAVTSADGCYYDDGALRGALEFTEGAFDFGADSLTLSLRWRLTPEDGSGTRSVSWSFTGARPTVTEASCAAVCAHGRRLGCSLCLASGCEADCEARFNDTVRRRMLATEACRVDYGGDSAAQCDAP